MEAWQFIKAKRYFIILVKRSRFSTFLLIFFLFSVYIFVFSESGILERSKRINQLHHQNDELTKLYNNYLSGNYTDIDIIRSGYVTPKGTVILFEGTKTEKKDDIYQIREMLDFNYDHLRVIWILLSAMLVILYLHGKKEDGDQLD